jgi:hypothetical protein
MHESISYIYQVETVEKTTPPDGVTGDDWYRYVLKKGNSIMEGKMAGTLKQVTSHADELVEQINMRNRWGKQKK